MKTALTAACVILIVLQVWSDERSASLKKMQEVMGEFRRPTCPLDPRTIESVDCGDYIRQQVEYQSEPGHRVVAYLLTPKKLAKETLGVLTLHQTHASGNKVVVGLGKSTNDEYAVELVKRGFVCIAPPYPLLVEYNPPLQELGYKSGTMKAIVDNIRALDLLETMPGVRKKSFAALGHSLGGHNGLYTAAFDERIQLVVTSCGFDSFKDYMNGNIRGWTSERYMPRLKDYKNYPFDFQDVLCAIAPRSVFVSAPIEDSNFKWESVDRVGKEAKERCPNLRLEIEHPKAGHVFPIAMREKAYGLIEKLRSLH